MPAAASIAVVHDHPTRHLSEDRLCACVEALLETEGATLVDLSIVLTDHDTVHRLNREYLSHDYPTDVLSFSLRTPKEDADEASPIPVDGEVYVDLDTAAERCAEFNATFEDEALRYVLHGVLHLVGYDDSTAAGREQMRAREDRYLRAAAPDA